MSGNRPRIVVLDGYTLTPYAPPSQPPEGEPTWDALRALGELTVHERTKPEDVVERARGAAVVLTNKALLPAGVIEALTQRESSGPLVRSGPASWEGLRYVGVLATGVNVVDVAAAGRRGVVVTNVPGYSTESVTQHVFALLLELASRVGDHDAAVKAGRWARGADFSFTTGPLRELAGLRFGVMGLGAIGQRVATVAHALGMQVWVSSRSRKDTPMPVKWCDVDELFRGCDVISLHCPLTEQTKGLVNAERLATMKPTAYLINTGRGPLLDERAVADALHAGKLAGVGLDVLCSEPPAQDNPLLRAPRCVVTPHVAWASVEARHRLMGEAVENLRAWLAGSPRNVVKPA